MIYNHKTIYKAFAKIARKSSIEIIDKKVLVTPYRLSVHNLNTEVSVLTPNTWTVSGSGVLPLDIVKEALGAATVTINFDGEKFAANIDGRDFSGPCRLADDYPQENVDGFTYSGCVGASSVSSVLDFVSDDIMRPPMQGVYIGEEVVATNGHILRHRNDSYQGRPFILRADAAAAMVQFWGGFKTRETKFGVSFHKNRVLLCSGLVQINSAVIDETYPNYKAVIPQDNDRTVTVRSDDFARAVKAVKPSMSKSYRGVELVFNHGQMIVTAKDQDRGTRSDVKVRVIDSHNVPTGYRIGFDGKYLETVFSNVHSEDFSFALSGPNRAAIISDEILLMPIMLKDE
jgi:hypothetical protein